MFELETSNLKLETSNLKLETHNSKPNQEPTEPSLPWPRLYALVLGELALLILFFYLFTRAFE